MATLIVHPHKNCASRHTDRQSETGVEGPGLQPERERETGAGPGPGPGHAPRPRARQTESETDRAGREAERIAPTCLFGPALGSFLGRPPMENINASSSNSRAILKQMLRVERARQ